MRSAKSTGRIVGLLLFVQLAGLTAPFILLMPAVTTGYMDVAAGMAVEIKLAVFMLFANAVVTMGIAIAGFPFFREYSVRMALWFLAFSVIWFIMQAVDNAHILSMLSLSRQYAESAGANADLFRVLGTEVRATRIWVHYTELLVIDTWFALLYGLLLRFRLVPRWLAGFGLLAVALHTVGIPLAMFIGYPSVLPLGFSLAISHLAIGGWLVTKGFPEGTSSELADLP
jgi:hypothetical protein